MGNACSKKSTNDSSKIYADEDNKLHQTKLDNFVDTASVIYSDRLS